jgi:hypothetical protein
MADFEDMFLWDGVKQLKIRFNPKVSSFKINRLESRINTIGSQYPFFFRNGVVKYREFPIGGLISYLADNNEEFLNHEEDLNIILADDARRKQTPIRKDIYHPIEITEEEYTFRNNNRRDEHYEKHGKYMGFDDAEEYEEAASDVVNNPESLHKTEKEDGDDVYYLKDSNEFVIVSPDGYIRTYFNPDDGIAYYNRQ